MSRLPTIDPATATGTVANLFAVVKQKLGAVPNLLRIIAHSPAGLEAYLGINGALNHGLLSSDVRERIALAVAEANGCEYCLAAHSALGRRAGLNTDQIAAARHGTADDPKAAALVRLALAIVAERGRVSDETLAASRHAGISDGEIAETVAHVALNVFTNYTNNLARTPLDFPAAGKLERAA